MLSCFSHVQLFATLWTAAHQAPLSMGFSRQEYWSWLPCPPSGDLPDPGIKPLSLKSLALSGGFFTTSTTWETPWVKKLTANAGDLRDTGSIPGSGRSPEGGHGNPLQYSCLENPMGKGAWWATVHRVSKSWTWLKWLSTHACSKTAYFGDWRSLFNVHTEK